MRKTILCILSVLALGVLTGCAQDEPIEADLSQIINQIEAQEIFDGDMENLTAASLEQLYNISSSEYVQFAGKINNIGISGDEAVIVEAANADAVAGIKAKMEQRYTIKLNEMDGYIPEEFEKIKNGSVAVEGNYVALLVASDQDKLNNIFKEGVYGE